MKRSFPININNTIYYIDEDAYELLNTYLSQLRQTFTGKEGDEIVSDIEGRINELFSQRAENSIITIDDVNSVIATMGQPEELGDDRETNGPASNNDYTGQQGPSQATEAMPKKLYRDIENKVFGGVLSGLAIRYDWNVTILRILVLFIGLCSALFPVAVAYLVSWMVIPAAETPRQKLEMHGRPVNLETIGRNLCGRNYDNNTADTIGAAVNIIAKAALAIFSISAAFILAASVVGLLITLLCALGYSFGSEQWMFERFGVTIGEGYPILRFFGISASLLAIAIPSAAVLWTGCVVFFKAKGAKKTLITTAVIAEIICIVAAIVLIAASLPDRYPYI